MCTDESIYRKYKENARLMLDLTTTDKESLARKKREEFYRVRGKWDLEQKGIDSFSRQELKKFYDWGVIRPR